MTDCDFPAASFGAGLQRERLGTLVTWHGSDAALDWELGKFGEVLLWNRLILSINLLPEFCKLCRRFRVRIKIAPVMSVKVKLKLSSKRTLEETPKFRVLKAWTVQFFGLDPFVETLKHSHNINNDRDL